MTAQPVFLIPAIRNISIVMLTTVPTRRVRAVELMPGVLPMDSHVILTVLTVSNTRVAGHGTYQMMGLTFTVLQDI